VAILCGLGLGDSLDNFPIERRVEVVARHQDALLPVTIDQELADMVDKAFDEVLGRQKPRRERVMD
jgi:hypothetical protein